MTTQEAYETQREFFTRPGAVKSMGIDPETGRKQCRYRGDEDGSACAVGCLLPEELYSTDFEAKNVMHILVMSRPVKSLLKDVSGSYLYDSQRAHDNADTVEQIVYNLDSIARQHGLKVVRS